MAAGIEGEQGRTCKVALPLLKSCIDGSPTRFTDCRLHHELYWVVLAANAAHGWLSNADMH